MLNESIHYIEGRLFCDRVPVVEIVAHTGTPVYIYSLKRAQDNLERIRIAFSALEPHIHYSAKANANLSVLRSILSSGAGIDAVSAGEIHRALLAGAKPEQIVFAGVGKTPKELVYALDQGVGWINVENEGELDLINDIAGSLGRGPVRVALRLNPDVQAATHPHIATGHGGAKFGLSRQTVHDLLARRGDYPKVHIAGLHVHIGSQLHNIEATKEAVQEAVKLMAPIADMRWINLGGGLPVAYHPAERVPTWESFASALEGLVDGYEVILEPGRSVIADAGILVTSVIYRKTQGGQEFLITDASMAELIRPALYQAHHEIVPLMVQNDSHDVPSRVFEIVGPVCETTDILGHGIRLLRDTGPGDMLVILTAGAYGMSMASNYNQRTRPPEVVISEDGAGWRIARQRETWDDLVHNET